MSKAQQIKLKAEKLKLDHIKQFHMKCESRKKLDFVKQVFEYCEMTQTYIFVNSLDFAEKIHFWLREAGLSSFILFSKQTKEERDDTMAKFREQKINVLITTNIIARGIDVEQAELVINFDVPQKKAGPTTTGDPEMYLHRIGRAGRFGRPGLAITLYDRDIDKEYLDQIVKYYDMGSKINELSGPEHLSQLLKEIRDTD